MPQRPLKCGLGTSILTRDHSRQLVVMRVVYDYDNDVFVVSGAKEDAPPDYL